MNAIAEKIAAESLAIRNDLIADQEIGKYIDTTNAHIPEVFMDAVNTSDIRLVVIGQDPTVKNEKARPRIKTVLNLDKPRGRLYEYISKICNELGLSLHEQVYATNFAKNFFIKPPTIIEEYNILKMVSPYWLSLLQRELAMFPNAIVITLGEPLLSVLMYDRSKALVKLYWDHKKDWQKYPTRNYSYIEATTNRTGRALFPFPHQPSYSRIQFYNNTLNHYIQYVKTFV
jgi:uracil-DNA glycosylase